MYVTPRSTSASVSSDEIASSPSGEEVAFSRQVSTRGDEWLESELAYLKQQNRHLEEKLDLLLKITLTLSPSSLEELQLGEKRRRTYNQPSQSYQSSYAALDTIRENSAMPKTNGSIEPMPYMNEKPAEVESMKAFVDIMLSEEKEDAANSGSDSDIDDSPADSPAPNVTSADDTFEDELMAEAMHAILPTNDLCDDDFNLSFDETEELPENIPAPSTFHSVANRAVDKSSGPDAVLSSDSYNFSGDIEEGNMPVGVHIISAHAELVDDDDSKGDDSVNDRRAWRKKMMCMMTVMFTILVVVCITVPAVILTQNKGKSINVYVEDEDEKIGRPFQKPSKPNGGKGYQGGLKEEGSSEETGFDDDSFYKFGDATLNTVNVTAETRSGSVTNIFAGRPERQGTTMQTHRPVPGDFTLNIEGFDFKCTQVPPLL